MILWFQRLRKDEEGQTLVLAALFGLVLMLCVLGTVNLGRAVYDKIELQTAADSAAYSQAAVEARVMNFTAYTNRAMVVHYASIMAASAYLTWLHFMYGGMKIFFTILSYLPYIGPIIKVVDQIFQIILYVFDGAVALLTPFLCAANFALYALQEGAWMAVWNPNGGRLAQLPPEAQSGAPNGRDYVPLWPQRVAQANQTTFSQVRGHTSMLSNVAESSVKFLFNFRDDAVQEARMHMLEIANSARNAWVAYGDRYDNPIPTPLGRHGGWKKSFSVNLGFIFKATCDAGFGNVARTELGTADASLINTLNSFGQVWSGQRFQAAVDCKIKAFGIPIHYSDLISFFSLVTMDQMFQTQLPFKNSYFRVLDAKNLLGKIVALILGATGIFALVKQQADQTKPIPDRYLEGYFIGARLFALSPYVYFAPRAGTLPGKGLTGALGNFAQPDVVIGMAKRALDYDAEPGASDKFGRRFQFGNGSAAPGSVDFSYSAQSAPVIPGMPPGVSTFQNGLNAVATAQVYYHRPGDWKEMPNLFNPLWGARLMPVSESNSAAKLGLTSAIPALKQFLLH